MNNEINRYAALSAKQRAEAALEMATEIAEESNRIYCLVSAAVDYLKSGKDVDPTGLALAETAEEMMRDIGQKYRLIDCLKAEVAQAA